MLTTIKDLQAQLKIGKPPEDNGIVEISYSLLIDVTILLDDMKETIENLSS